MRKKIVQESVMPGREKWWAWQDLNLRPVDSNNKLIKSDSIGFTGD
jgi:hypothetical protein